MMLMRRLTINYQQYLGIVNKLGLPTTTIITAVAAKVLKIISLFKIKIRTKHFCLIV